LALIGQIEFFALVQFGVGQIRAGYIQASYIQFLLIPLLYHNTIFVTGGIRTITVTNPYIICLSELYPLQ